MASLGRIGSQPGNQGQFDDLVEKLVAWAKINPDTALAYVKQLKPTERQSEVVTKILVGLARSNPQAAWDWVSTNSPENDQDIGAVLNTIGRSDPTMAWKFAAQYSQEHPVNASSAYGNALIGIIYSGNYADAARFVEQAGLQTPGSNYNFPSLIVTEWGKYAPEQAAAWVQTLPAGASRNSALAQLGQSWVGVDPNAAANFAIQLTPGDGQKEMLANVMGSWVATDPASAAGWVNRFEANPAFDQTLAQIATLPSIGDYATAIGWADSITDKELETESLTTIFNRWWTNAPAVAQASLQSSAFPPEVRDEVLKRVQQLQKPVQ